MPDVLLAERRNALSSLDYALVSGTDGAAESRAEVEASMRKTAEEVGPQHVSVTWAQTNTITVYKRIIQCAGLHPCPQSCIPVITLQPYPFSPIGLHLLGLLPV